MSRFPPTQKLERLHHHPQLSPGLLSAWQGQVQDSVLAVEAREAPNAQGPWDSVLGLPALWTELKGTLASFLFNSQLKNRMYFREPLNLLKFKNKISCGLKAHL